MIGKTNANIVNENSSNIDMTIIYQRVPVNFSGKIQNVIQQEDKIVIQPFDFANLYVSSNGGGEFIAVDLGFSICDLIYANSLQKFIAVGYTASDTFYIYNSQPRMAYSEDAITWVSCDISSVNPLSRIYSIREQAEKLVIFGIVSAYATSQKRGYIAYKITLDNSIATVISQSIYQTQVSDGSKFDAIKGSGNTILCGSYNGGKNIFASSDGNSVNYYGTFPDYYNGEVFVRKAENSIYTSYDGKDYILAGETEKKISFIFKYNYKYYGIAEGKIYCGESIQDMLKNDSGFNFESAVITMCWIFGETIYLGTYGALFDLRIMQDYNPDVVLIKSISAKQALADAKDYTNFKIEELKRYVDSLNLI